MELNPLRRSADGMEPAGTRGFLFADLRGYTAYVEHRGDRAGAALLTRFRAVVRDAVATSDGAEVKTEGDSFYVVFDTVSAAVRCGLAIVDAAMPRADAGRAEAIPVGIGVHAGESIELDGGYVGSAVNIAARLAAEARAGELLVSDTVRALTRTAIDARFASRGVRRLKGVSEPVAVFRVTRALPGIRPEGTAGAWRSAASRAPMVAAVVLALLGVAVAAVALRPSGQAAAASASPQASSPPTASAAAIAPAGSTLHATPSSSADIFPNAAEQVLVSALRTLPNGFSDTCHRGPYPEMWSPFGTRAPIASVECSPPITMGASDVIVQQFGPEAATIGFVDSFISGIAQGGAPSAIGEPPANERIPAGDCAISSRASGRWSSAQDRGSIVCWIDRTTRAAHLDWSYDQSVTIVRATNPNGDSAALHEFFRKYADFLAP